MRIEAAVLRTPGGPLSIEPLELDEPRDDEILVSLVASGVCHTDLRACEDDGLVPRPIVLGHEGAGIVRRVGARVRKVAPGDAVLMTFDSCGVCACCLRAAPAYCHELIPRNFGGRRADGSTVLVDARGYAVFGSFFGQSSFASHTLCRERNVVKCGAELPLQLLAPLGCGVQTGAGAVMRSMMVRPGESLAVFGTGAVGLSAVMAARLVGAHPIIGIDPSPARREVAREVGATHVLDAGRGDLREQIFALTGQGVQYAIDTSGAASALEDAIACLAPLGTCGVVASTREPHVRFNARHLLTGGRSIRGIAEGDSVPDLFVPALMEHLRRGELPLDRLVHVYPFERINDAIRDARAGVVIKPVVRFT